jgi:hypothetical protein
MNPLRRHMIDEMQTRNLTQNTQRAYIEQVARFAGPSTDWGIMPPWQTSVLDLRAP